MGAERPHLGFLLSNCSSAVSKEVLTWAQRHPSSNSHYCHRRLEDILELGRQWLIVVFTVDGWFCSGKEQLTLQSYRHKLSFT